MSRARKEIEEALGCVRALARLLAPAHEPTASDDEVSEWRTAKEEQLQYALRVLSRHGKERT